MWMNDQLPQADYIKTVQEQLMEFVMDVIVNPAGEFHDNRRPIP